MGKLRFFHTYSVMVLPEMNDPTFENLPINFYGVCTDYILKIKI